MPQYINKTAIKAEIERIKKEECPIDTYEGRCKLLWFEQFLSFIDTLEVKDPYEQCVQYDSIKAGIQAHAEAYSFNIQSELFNQLTKEQQALWRKEIEQAVISGGDAGYLLAKDPRYKESLEVKKVDMGNSMVCKVDWYDGFLLDYTQEQQDKLLEKMGVDVGDKIRVILIKE